MGSAGYPFQVFPNRIVAPAVLEIACSAKHTQVDAAIQSGKTSRLGKCRQNPYGIRFIEHQIVNDGATSAARDCNRIRPARYLTQHGQGIAIAPFKTRIAPHIQTDLAIFGTITGHGLDVDVAHLNSGAVDNGVADNKAATPTGIVGDGHAIRSLGQTGDAERAQSHPTGIVADSRSTPFILEGRQSIEWLYSEGAIVAVAHTDIRGGPSDRINAIRGSNDHFAHTGAAFGIGKRQLVAGFYTRFHSGFNAYGRSFFTRTPQVAVSSGSSAGRCAEQLSRFQAQVERIRRTKSDVG